MAQYTINLNERTAFGRNILAMLQAIPQIGLAKVETKRPKQNALQRSLAEAERGEINVYSSTDELFAKLGI